MALEATEEGVGPSIVFSLEDDAPGSVSVLDEERGKHKTRQATLTHQVPKVAQGGEYDCMLSRLCAFRAERFGTVYKEPARHRTDLIMEAKRERLRREGFKTGFDFFSEVRNSLFTGLACN